MAVTKTTLYSGSWTTLRDLIQGSLVDPKERFKVKFVHAGRLDPNNNGFCGYPYVVLRPVLVDKNPLANDEDASLVEFTANFEVIGLTYIEVDTMTDALINVFNTTANLNSLRSNGLDKGTSIGDTGTGEDFIDGKRVFTRNITILFKKGLQVMS
jgi:hypothetical protein